MSRTCLAAGAIFVGLLFGLTGNAAGPSLSSIAPKVLVAISGTDSHVVTPSCKLITNSADWARVWSDHLGTTVDDYYRPLMEVDFDHCMLVALFRGEERHIRRIEIEAQVETADAIVIRFGELGYQTMDSDKEGPLQRAYAFVIIPKTEKAIIVEGRLVPLGPVPRVWESWARLNERSR
jgi:hypothetical protein